MCSQQRHRGGGGGNGVEPSSDIGTCPYSGCLRAGSRARSHDVRMTATDPTSAPARPTVYDAIGGSAAVAAAVDVLYARLLADPQLTHYFDGVDVRGLASHMRAFLTAAL